MLLSLTQTARSTCSITISTGVEFLPAEEIVTLLSCLSSGTSQSKSRTWEASAGKALVPLLALTALYPALPPLEWCNKIGVALVGASASVNMRIGSTDAAWFSSKPKPEIRLAKALNTKMELGSFFANP